LFIKNYEDYRKQETHVITPDVSATFSPNSVGSDLGVAESLVTLENF